MRSAKQHDVKHCNNNYLSLLLRYAFEMAELGLFFYQHLKCSFSVLWSSGGQILSWGTNTQCSLRCWHRVCFFIWRWLYPQCLFSFVYIECDLFIFSFFASLLVQQQLLWMSLEKAVLCCLNKWYITGKIFTLLHNSILLLLCSDNQKMVLFAVFEGIELKIVSFLLLVQKPFKWMENSMLLQVVSSVVRVIEEQSYIWTP